MWKAHLAHHVPLVEREERVVPRPLGLEHVALRPVVRHDDIVAGGIISKMRSPRWSQFTCSGSADSSQFSKRARTVSPTSHSSSPTQTLLSSGKAQLKASPSEGRLLVKLSKASVAMSASATAAAALRGGGAYLRPFRGRAWAMACTPLRDRCQSLMRGTWRSECSPAATGASIAARRTRMLPVSLPSQCRLRTWPAGQLLLR